MLKILAALCAIPLSLSAQSLAPSIALTPGGLEIDSGSMGKFTVAAPSLNPGGGKVAFSLSGSDSAVATYASGARLEYHFDAATRQVIFNYSNLPAGAHDFRFTMPIPIALAQGGQYSFEVEPLHPLPAEKVKQMIQAGPGGQLNLKDAAGAGFSFAGPGNWRQLQDNRVFNGVIFEYQFLWDIPAHPGQSAFAMKVAALPASGPVALVASVPPSAVAKAAAPAPLKKLVDQYGQPLSRDYPGKVKDDDELKKDVEADKAYYNSLNPPATDTYGGLPDSGQKYDLHKTGFFHIEKIKDRFVMVDPDGNLFFERGLCPIAPLADYTLAGGRYGAFEWLPTVQNGFRSALQDNGYAPIISFYRANVIRKYGKPFDDEEQSGIATTRIRKLGFNAEGAFGQETKTMAAMQLPYTAVLGVGLPAISMQSAVPDPFTPDAEKKVDTAFTKNVTPRASDPLLIGYFLGNEQHFEDLPRLIPALKGSKVGAKRRLVQMLQEKYGDISKFNAAWQPKTPAATFDELIDTPLSIQTQQASDDMKAFQDLFTDTYYGLITRVFHNHDHNHLLIGSRWQPGTANSSVLLKNAGKYLDVISVNYYTYGIEKDFLKKLHDLSGGKPLLMSEWYYAAGDRAAGGGTKTVGTQAERGLAYRNYVETVASLPYVIGDEWFSYLDQPVTGRFFEGYNGEAGNIGIISSVDRPYKEALAEMMKTNYDIYPVVLGQRPPFHFDDPRFNIGPGGGRKVVNVPIALPGMKIDGLDSDWPGRPGEHLSKSNLVLGSDAGSLEGDFKLCWDPSNLYLYIQIADPTPMSNPNKGASIYAGDGIELFVGPENVDEGGELAFTDRQILLSASKETGSVQYYIGGAPTNAKINMEVVKNVSGDGYSLEAAIPWAALNMQPVEGKAFLFDIGIDDAAPGHGRSRQLMWNGISRNSGDRSKWGLARLVK